MPLILPMRTGNQNQHGYFLIKAIYQQFTYKFLMFLNQLQLGELEVREVWGNGFSNRSGISGLRHPLSRAILSHL